MPTLRFPSWQPGLQLTDPIATENPITRMVNYVVGEDGTLQTRPDLQYNIASTFTGIGALPADEIFCHRIVRVADSSEEQIVFGTNNGIAGPITTLPNFEKYITNNGPVREISPWGGGFYWNNESESMRYHGGGIAYVAGLPPISDSWADTPIDGNVESDLIGGDKTGSFSISFSFYDENRNIHGPRTRPYLAAYVLESFPIETNDVPGSLISSRTPITFGINVQPPQGIWTGTPAVLKDEYAKYGPTHIAIWASQTWQFPLMSRFDPTNGTDADDKSYGTFYQNKIISGEAIGTDVHFLETWTRVEDGTGVSYPVRLSNQELAANGAATDAYHAPLPCEFQVIVDGTLVSFFPNDDGVKARIEYSRGHPEQIARWQIVDTTGNRFLRRPTGGESYTHTGGLYGIPIRYEQVGSTHLMWTREGVYALAASSRGVGLRRQADYGLVREGALTNTDIGVFWASQGALVMSGGGNIQNITSKIGVAKNLHATDPAIYGNNAAVGFFPARQWLFFNYDPDGKTWMYDFNNGVACEWNDAGTNRATYIFNWRTSTESALLFVTNGVDATLTVDNADAIGTSSTELEWWLSDQPDLRKKIKDCVLDLLDFTPTSGTVLTIEGYDSYGQYKSGDKNWTVDYTYDGSNFTPSAGISANKRNTIGQAIGRSAHLIRFHLRNTTKVKIRQIEIDYEYTGRNTNARA